MKRDRERYRSRREIGRDILVVEVEERKRDGEIEK